MAYWLVKSESSVYSIDDLKRDGATLWEGVRNYQARNYLKSMKVGEKVLYYHSVDDPIGVVGLAKVKAEASPDPSQFDKKSEYFDEKATKDNPRWFCPLLQYVKKFSSILSREQLIKESKLKGMVLLQKMSRLSVQPVSREEFETIIRLSEE